MFDDDRINVLMGEDDGQETITVYHKHASVTVPYGDD